VWAKQSQILPWASLCLVPIDSLHLSSKPERPRMNRVRYQALDSEQAATVSLPCTPRRSGRNQVKRVVGSRLFVHARRSTRDPVSCQLESGRNVINRNQAGPSQSRAQRREAHRGHTPGAQGDVELRNEAAECAAKRLR
jgi:hypothetical protein